MQNASNDPAGREVRTIYGPDDRQDLYQVTDPTISELAESVVLMVPRVLLVKNNDGSFSLKVRTLKQEENLCDGEPYENQYISGICSGFFLTPSHIVTAGHCIKDNQGNSIYLDAYYITGFQMTDPTTTVTHFRPDQVFETVKLIRTFYVKDTDLADYTIVQVVCADGSTPGKPLSLPTIPLVDTNDSLFTLGHPSGLPMKYTPNGHVTDTTPTSSFITNLDTFVKSSGSPVFNKNKKVVGVVARGIRDFRQKPPETCFRVTRYPMAKAAEKIQRITGIVGQVCDLAIQLDIGNTGLKSARQVTVSLHEGALDVLLPSTDIAPNTSYTFPLDAKQMEVFCIDDINFLAIGSPRYRLDTKYSWLLERIVIKVNGGQILHSIEVHKTLRDDFETDPVYIHHIPVIEEPENVPFVRPYHDLSLYSASYEKGNRALINLNGHPCGQWGRGMNVAIIDQKTGKVVQTATYDTNDRYSQADDFTSLIKSLLEKKNEGRIVAIAVMDEASYYLTQDAKDICQSLGSEYIQSLGWRTTWTFVGITGKGRVAEALGKDDWSSQVQVHLPTTDKQTGGGIEVRCHSAAYEFGNAAFVTINGERVAHTYDRGLNVVVIDRFSGKPTLSQTFDTYGDANAAGKFVTFMNALPFGQIVAIAVKDAAEQYLTEEARLACHSIGSSLIDDVGDRESWAIVGIKGAAGQNCVTENYNSFGVTEACSWFSL